MIDKAAIEALNMGTAESIAAATVALVHEAEAASVAGLPDNFTVHDLEKFLPIRRRARGTMTTQVIVDFAKYIGEHKEEGASVFVNVDNMEATAVLNLGTPADPGHADNKAVLKAKPTAAYRALLSIANGSPASQVKVAEFLEDWGLSIVCTHDGEIISTPKAVAAVRQITIEGLLKLENTEGQLSASRSTFEQVQATSKEQIPTLIDFTCKPYVCLSECTFQIRLGIQTGGDKPTLILRIVKQEEHQERMGDELARLIHDAAASSAPVLLGGYAATA
jgi:uncharacterized protein YfdQ (DUF2303 family)